MDDLLAPFTSGIAMRALVACVLVGIAAALLGCVLVVRRLSLLGDAIGHAVLPGIGLAWLTLGAGVLGLFVGGLITGLITAIVAGLASRLTRLKEDAAFAAIFAICGALGVILVSRAGTQVDLVHVLYGNLLAVGRADLVIAAASACLVVMALALGWRAVVLECFDPAFHRAIGGRGLVVQLGLLVLVVMTLLAALHVVGAVLALGLFMLPAVSAYLWCERWGAMLVCAAVISLVGSVIGICVSWHLALPPGPSVVAALGLAFIISAIISPRHGALARLLRPRRHRTESGEAHCDTH
jgi:zinc/manganese transport system permease protein